MQLDAAAAASAEGSAVEGAHRNLVFRLLVLGNAVHLFAQLLDHPAIQANMLFQLHVSDIVKGLA